jgi:hypothetical protein
MISYMGEAKAHQTKEQRWAAVHYALYLTLYLTIPYYTSFCFHLRGAFCLLTLHIKRSRIIEPHSHTHLLVAI